MDPLSSVCQGVCLTFIRPLITPGFTQCFLHHLHLKLAHNSREMKAKTDRIFWEKDGVLMREKKRDRGCTEIIV